MKKIILGIFAVLVLVTAVQAQAPVAAYRVDGMWHFVDREGKDLFPPKKLHNIGGYSEGYILIVKKEGARESWGFMDSTGNNEYYVDNVDVLNLFHDGMAMTIKFKDPSGRDRLYGFINKAGEQIIPMKYLDATIFNEGLGWVMNFDERGYINKQGEFEIEITEDKFGYPFFEGLAGIHNDSAEFGFIDKSGKIVIEHQYDEVQYFSEGYCPVNINGKYGFINKEGESVVQPQFDFVKPYEGDFAFAGSADAQYKPVWGIIDRNGNFVMQPEFQDTRDFENGIACVSKYDKWFFVDNSGNRIFDEKYQHADSFVNGIAYINDGKKRAYIDLSGNVVFEIPEKADAVVDLRVNRVLK